MTIPRITIGLIFLLGMLTGCGTPLIEIDVDVHSGVQPGHPPDGGGCPPNIPWYLCVGGATVNSGVIKNVHGTGKVKVYEVEVLVKGESQKLHFSEPPDDVEDGLKVGDQVIISFGTPKKLGKLK